MWYMMSAGAWKVSYYSNCGCMEWDKFIEAVEEIRRENTGGTS